jgi:two-component system LytT family sensor kinase
VNGAAQATEPLSSPRAAGRPPSAPPHALDQDGLEDGDALGLVRRWIRGWPFLVLWSLAALVSTNQVYFLWQQKEGPPLSYWRAFVWQGVPWAFWLLATPALVWLGRRFPLERRIWPKHAAIHLVANVGLASAHLAFAAVMGRVAGQMYYHTAPLHELVRMMLAKNVHLEVLVYWGVTALVHASEYHRRYREREIVAAQLETKLAQAELAALKMQLHPHFLFNTLHAIAVLVRKQDTKTSLRMLTGLSGLLRLALDQAGRQIVPLRQELDFLDRYLEIEKTRFQDRLTVRKDIAPEVLDAAIPNFILQPIVENAIRHGIAPRASAGRVEIRARRQGDALVVEVRDDGRGLRPGDGARQPRGMGLRNVRARLEQLYAGEQRLSVEPHPEGGVLVTIALPLRLAVGDSRDDHDLRPRPAASFEVVDG